MGDISGDDFEFGVVLQASSGVRRAVGVLKFSRIFHKMHAEFMLVNELLTYETLRGSTVEESNIIGLFLCGV